MRIGITGHQRLKDASRWERVKRAIEAILAHAPTPLIGVTSLAIGADQLFANVVLQQDGLLEAIIPFEGYELTFAEGHDRQEYQRLLIRAARVESLPRMGSDEHAYFEAGKRVVDLADVVVAVWDGQPAAGLGGTADVVAYAQQQGKKVIHLDPTAMK